MAQQGAVRRQGWTPCQEQQRSGAALGELPKGGCSGAHPRRCSLSRYAQYRFELVPCGCTPEQPLFEWFEGYTTLAVAYESYSTLGIAGYPHVPPDCVPIADVYDSGYLMLAMDGVYKHNVLYYGFNMLPDPDEPYENVRFAGKNFTDFINRLRIEFN